MRHTEHRLRGTEVWIMYTNPEICMKQTVFATINRNGRKQDHLEITVKEKNRRTVKEKHKGEVNLHDK